MIATMEGLKTMNKGEAANIITRLKYGAQVSAGLSLKRSAPFHLRIFRLDTKRRRRLWRKHYWQKRKRVEGWQGSMSVWDLLRRHINRTHFDYRTTVHRGVLW